MNKEGTTYTIVFVFIVSFAFVFLLSMTNELTRERVSFNQEVARQTAVLTAMGVTVAGPEEAAERYSIVSADRDAGLYAAVVDGRTVFARQWTGAGLWGPISGVLAVNDSFDEIVGLEIVDDNETPGLGGRINEPWFKEQFRGVGIPARGITVVPAESDADRSPSSGVVDAVTGATRTSDAMESILNTQLETMRSEDVRQRFARLAEGARR